MLKGVFCDVCCYQKPVKSSILKPTGTRLSMQSKPAASTSTSSQRTVTKADGTTTNKATSSRTANKDHSKQKSSDSWDDSSWGDQWWQSSNVFLYSTGSIASLHHALSSVNVISLYVHPVVRVALNKWQSSVTHDGLQFLCLKFWWPFFTRHRFYLSHFFHENSDDLF